MASIDVFRSNFRLSPKVCILAPGPNGRGHYHEIPADCDVIAVSKAVLIDDVPKKRAWVMCHGDQSWFEHANIAFRGSRIFSAAALREARDKLNPDETCYFFEPPADEVEPETLDRIDGSIRYGTTVSGCALQIAYNFGAREILLCGVDMSGDDYWDGTRNVHAHHGETWPVSQKLNLVIRWLGETRGVRVETLSETKLQVPCYRGAPL
jgi:hypothetical protein